MIQATLQASSRLMTRRKRSGRRRSRKTRLILINEWSCQNASLVSVYSKARLHAYRYPKPRGLSFLSFVRFATCAPTRRRATVHALAETVIALSSSSHFLHQLSRSTGSFVRCRFFDKVIGRTPTRNRELGASHVCDALRGVTLTHDQSSSHAIATQVGASGESSVWNFNLESVYAGITVFQLHSRLPKLHRRLLLSPVLPILHRASRIKGPCHCRSSRHMQTLRRPAQAHACDRAT
jgi:hypothetical protein